MNTVFVAEHGRYSFYPPLEVPYITSKESVGVVVAGALAVKKEYDEEVVPHFVQGMGILIDDLATNLDEQIRIITEELFDHDVVHV